MAKLSRLLLLFIVQCIIGLSKCQDTSWDELATFVLNSFNDEPNSVYMYNAAKVINGYAQNDSESAYYLKLDFDVRCNSEFISETECFPKNLICEVIVLNDAGQWKLKDNETKCNLPVSKEFQNPETQDENKEHPSFEQQKEDAKAILDNVGPFLLNHLNPLPERSSSSAEEKSIDEDEPIVENRPLVADEPTNEGQTLIKEEPTVEEEPIIKEETTIEEETLVAGKDEPIVEERVIVSEEPIVDKPLVEVVEPLVVKKQMYCTGCVTDIDVNIPALQELTELALTMIDDTSNNLYKHNVVRITKAQKQVVSGIKYILSIEISETDCLKTSAQERGTCEPNSVNSRTCVVEYLDKPWLKSRTIISNNCSQHVDNNNLENEIQPHFAHKPESERQGIFDYLDSMDEKVNDMETPQYGSEVIPEPYALESQVEVEEEKVVEMNKETSNESVEEEKEAKQESNEQGTEKESESNESFKDAVKEEKSNKKEKSKFEMIDDWLDGGVFRKKREVRGGNRFGGLKDISETEKKLVHDLAELAVQTLDEIDADDSKRIVLEILEAKKQLVDAAVLYSLKIRVGSTSCNENGVSKKDCLEDQIAAPKICIVQMHRSFAADSPKNVKVVKSECTSEPRGRHRRQLAGGFSPLSVDDQFVKDIASFAVFELDKTTNSMYKQSIVRVVSAEQQVVAGTNTRLKLELVESKCQKGGTSSGPCPPADKNAVSKFCDVVVWDRPWLKKRVLTSASCSPNDAGKTKTKRSAKELMVGGASEIDVKDPYLQTIAKLSLDHIDGKSNSLYSQKVVKINHATRQVVAGIKYTLSIEIGYTGCRKGHAGNHDSCEVSESSNNQICTVVVWDRPWLKETRIESATCSPAPATATNRVKRSANIGGGTHDIHLGMFHKFMAEHDKVYSSHEELKRRFHIYRANMKKVETLRKTERGTGTYGATRFADLTSKEFKKHYLGFKPELRKENIPQLHQAEIPQITLPPEYDWRNYNIVTPVKNQGMCGSCWAFSVTGNIEGQWALRRGQLLSLSEQELVDCDKVDSGCEGGLPSNAYNAITEIGGLETETDYPYDGADEKCHFNKSEVKVTVTGGLNITTNETEMAQWLVKNGPISIGINANAMQFYMGGVSHPWKMLCDPNNLDHGVLIVGYGVHKTSIRHKILPYWIVKNSWGPHWGEQGYYRVYRGDSTCGVNQMATSAIVG